jgi:hypothetical protein
MGLFNNLMSKIFSHASSASVAAPGTQTQSAPPLRNNHKRQPRQLQLLLRR